MNSFSTTNSAEIQTHYPAPSGDITTSISDRHPMGIKWIGKDGWVFVDRGKIDASNRQWIQESFDHGPIQARVSLSHHRDFLGRYPLPQNLYCSCGDRTSVYNARTPWTHFPDCWQTPSLECEDRKRNRQPRSGRSIEGCRVSKSLEIRMNQSLILRHGQYPCRFKSK